MGGAQDTRPGRCDSVFFLQAEHLPFTDGHKSKLSQPDIEQVVGNLKKVIPDC
jgi:hypothetical protein